MTGRRFEFTPTAAVETARRRRHYIACPVCDASSERYLFHRSGARFVQCRSCGLVYVDPIDPEEAADFAVFQLDPIDEENLLADFALVLRELSRAFEAQMRRPMVAAVMFGQWHAAFAELAAGMGISLTLGGTSSLLDPDALPAELGTVDVVILHRLLEGTHDPAALLDALRRHMRRDAALAVTFANMSALPNRVFRRRLRVLFDRQLFLYDANNLERLMWRHGFHRIANRRLRTRLSLGYIATRASFPPAARSAIQRSGLREVTLAASTGLEAILFSPTMPDAEPERLSIIVPVYNEERYIADVLDTLIAKELPIDKEILVVESNSTDGSRDVVRQYEGRPGVRVIYQEKARGKGHAVREGLAAAMGTIILIQDADFEYDLDDYEALLEPLLQHRTSFVLGSRSLGLDDWKVRKYASSPVKGFLMNLAQVVFAQTFNVLYQQRVSDINTMFKVFRRECIAGCTFGGDGFNFDIELVCKIVRNGFGPMEVPVNYVSRGFDEGKKINFLFDAYPSYFMLFRSRLGRF